MGAAWPTPRRPTLRRVFMRRTKHHIYYRPLEAEDTLLVVAIWGAPKGQAPDL